MDKLGISMEEQKRLSGVAVDFVMDSVSVATSFKDKLAELGIIFCSMSEAIQEHPDLVRKHLGTVVPVKDNFFSALNAAVFTDGSFLLHPQGVQMPHGTVHLLPHQRSGYRTVRAHTGGGRRGQLRELPGRLHRPTARRKPTARCGRGTHRQGRR